MNLRRIRALSFYLLNKIYCFVMSGTFVNKIAIVGSHDYNSKYYENVLLKHQFNKMRIGVDIVIWDDPLVDYGIYEIVLIRTVWGYENSVNEFSDFLTRLKVMNIPVVNDIDLLLENIDKHKQYRTHLQNMIPVLDSEFIFNGKREDVQKRRDIVIKPIISASGYHTYYLGDRDLKNKIEVSQIDEILSKINEDKGNGLIIQNYIDAAEEVSLVYARKEFLYAIKRISGVFTEEISSEYLEAVSEEIISLGNRIVDIPDYSRAAYMRIDLIEKDEHFFVLEVELLDPILFLQKLPKDKRKKAVSTLAESIIGELV